MRPDSKARRWIVLAALMAATLACEVQWLSHAAVARPAAAYYAGQFDPSSLFNIDFLSMSYMLVFLIACLPASWLLARRGLGFGVGVGAALLIVGSLGKAVWASTFAAQVGFQLLLAVSQPFLTNAATTMARDWFPVGERATASGLASLSQYLGFVAALALAPAMVQVDPSLPGYGSGMDTALAVFAALGVAAGAFALAAVRRGPNRALAQDEPGFLDSLKRLMGQRDFRWTLLLFFLGLGIMNTVTALTDSIAAAMGVKDSNGFLGLGLIIGGIVGAIVLPILSDRLGRRKAFIVLCMALTVPALWALVLAPQGWYALGVAAMALLGLALMSAGPIGFQYAAEVTAPVPESASQGILLLAGQVSGLAFTAGMSAGGVSAIRPWLVAFGVAAVAMALLSLRLKESPAVGAGAGERSGV
jgi:MFS family permease